MPAKPRWYRDLGKLVELVSAMPSESVVTRRQVEDLFGVRQTEAQRIMRNCGAAKLQNMLTVEARTLKAYLQAIHSGGDYDREAARTERIAAELEKERRLLPARKIEVRIKRAELPEGCEELPRTIDLQPGLLQITFTDPEDLLKQLMQLAHAMMDDYPGFEKLAGPSKREVDVAVAS